MPTVIDAGRFLVSTVPGVVILGVIALAILRRPETNGILEQLVLIFRTVFNVPEKNPDCGTVSKRIHAAVLLAEHCKHAGDEAGSAAILATIPTLARTCENE